MLTSTTHVRVRYAETDQMGVVYHANYLVWLEIGRVDFIRELGLDYKTLEQHYGLGIAVVEVQLRYKAPARYDENLLIRTQLLQIRGCVLRFAYTVHRQAEREQAELLLAEGHTTHVVVDRAMRKARLPEQIAEVFRQAGLITTAAAT